MNFVTIISLLQTVVTQLPNAISTATQLYDLGSKFFATLHGREPTADEIVALRKQIDEDVAKALAPLPPAQPGDPDYKPDSEQ